MSSLQVIPTVSTDTLAEALEQHLHWWGLRRFNSDPAYFEWQRRTIRAADLTLLHQLAEQKRAPGAGPDAEVAFYDYSTRPEILPTLYSQRYDYFMAVGPLVGGRIPSARSVLDFGCGVGILTTFYARQYPDVSFVGVDRSLACIAAAQARAASLGLPNLQFEQHDAEQATLPGSYALIISTHALVQVEADPGIPSANWRTFDRSTEPRLQREFEQRTGLGPRLDHLCGSLARGGRMIVFEKTRQLARRVPFQRALAARGLSLVESPIPLRYTVVEEIADDGPLYVLARASHDPGDREALQWDERPECAESDHWYRCQGKAAQAVWERVPDRTDLGIETWRVEPIGQVKVERGRFGQVLGYLYLTAGDGIRALLVGCESDLEKVDQTNSVVDALVRQANSSHASADPTPLPLYENHSVSAQAVWARLPDRRLLQHTTREEAEGRQMHVELGSVRDLVYLYWANTFDQRQIVIVERQQSRMLEQYYHEFLDGR